MIYHLYWFPSEFKGQVFYNDREITLHSLIIKSSQMFQKKEKLKKSDDQTNIDNYRVAANIT